jgi:hypothetical protein
MLRLAFSIIVGVVLTLALSFVGERSANATYPDIMGCETGCRVTATGWPLVFVRDYTGMSVVNTAISWRSGSRPIGSIGSPSY